MKTFENYEQPSNLGESLPRKDSSSTDCTQQASWDCPYCPYKAKRDDYIHTHILDNHSTVTYYKCLHCDFLHSQMSSLKEHIKRKHENIKYPCPECKYKFTTAWNREGHILTRHSRRAQKILETLSKQQKPKESNKKCPFCEHESDTSVALRKHFEKNHDDLVRFKCLYCSFKHEKYHEIGDHMKCSHADNLKEIKV